MYVTLHDFTFEVCALPYNQSLIIASIFVILGLADVEDVFVLFCNCFTSKNFYEWIKVENVLLARILDIKDRPHLVKTFSPNMQVVLDAW